MDGIYIAILVLLFRSSHCTQLHSHIFLYLSNGFAFSFQHYYSVFPCFMPNYRLGSPLDLCAAFPRRYIFILHEFIIYNAHCVSSRFEVLWFWPFEKIIQYHISKAFRSFCWELSCRASVSRGCFRILFLFHIYCVWPYFPYSFLLFHWAILCFLRMLKNIWAQLRPFHCHAWPLRMALGYLPCWWCVLHDIVGRLQPIDWGQLISLSFRFALRC